MNRVPQLNMQSYSDELHALTKRLDDDVAALGEKVREQLVIPACRKYRLRFTSGMGTFYFERRARKDGDYNEPRYGDRKDLDTPVPHGYRGLSGAAKATLGPLLDLLNEEISYDHYLGYWVNDVD